MGTNYYWHSKPACPTCGHVDEEEYGRRISADEMLGEILLRSRLGAPENPSSWYGQNHAVPGPNGLARARLGGNVIEHGAGTYDLHTGDFS